ncbi:MAG: sigma-70 family RNA polymerase sigma factor [Ktedonobacteraceae bacterium]
MLKSTQTADEQNSSFQQSSLPQASDEDLLSAIAGGAVWAMEPLYQRYNRLLYSLAYTMVTDHQVAQNLTQETFLAVWRRASAYAPQAGAVRSWLLSILRHRTIDYLRALRRRSSLQEVRWEQVEEEEQPLLPDAWDEAWRSILRSQVRIALTQIPLEQRRVIALAYFQGWTQPEIAQEYGIPLGTVKTRMRLGLLNLKQVIDQMGFTEL